MRRVVAGCSVLLVALTGLAVATPLAAVAATPAVSGTFSPLQPARIMDTRPSSHIGSSTTLGAGQTVDQPVLGQGGVPSSGVSAVVLNVVAVNPTMNGYLTVFPSGVSRPTASNLNFVAGQTVPNAVTVGVGADGAVAVYNSAGSTDVIFDVAGYYAGGTATQPGTFNPVAPSRVMDTRPGAGQVGSQSTLGSAMTASLMLRSVGVVPANAGAVVLNVTAVQPTSSGYVTVFPHGTSVPNVSNINYVPGQIVPNQVTVKLGSNGAVDFYNNAGSVDLVVDVDGYYVDGTPATQGAFVPLAPTRVLDTRNSGGPVAAGHPVTVDPSINNSGVPVTGDLAIVSNVTATEPTNAGYIAAYPAGGNGPASSNLNFGPGQTTANAVTVGLGSGKTNLVSNPSGTVQMILDVSGYFMGPAPTVTSVSPAQGPAAGGQSVTISGANLWNATVMFGSATGTNVVVSGDGTSLTVTTPAETAGATDVTVSTPGGGTSSTSAADSYTYVAAPTLTSVSPNSGPTAGGQTVTITGANLQGAAVMFGSVAGTNVNVSADGTSLTVTTPAEPQQLLFVTVTTVGGTTANTNSAEYLFWPAPTVTSVSPSSGPVAGGNVVTVTGTNLSQASVKFGSVAGTNVFVNNAGTQLQVTAPAESPAQVDVVVTTYGGPSVISPADEYAFLAAPPTVTVVSPQAGPTAGGTTVTVTGTNLWQASVMFGSVAGTHVVVNAAGTSLTVTAPAQAGGTVDVTVKTGVGTSPTSSADGFTYVAPPTITGVSPSQGTTAGGTTITITGTNLQNASVLFGSVAGTNVVVNATGTSLTVTSPAESAGTVDITVTTTVGGTSATSSADHYTFVKPLLL